MSKKKTGINLNSKILLFFLNLIKNSDEKNNLTFAFPKIFPSLYSPSNLVFMVELLKIVFKSEYFQNLGKYSKIYFQGMKK